MVDLWRLFDSANGGGHLPEDVMRQPAKTLECFKIMSAAREKLRTKQES